MGTDTVGFVADLPHDLVASFHGTLSATADADCVALVADASDPLAEFRWKLETSLGVVADARGDSTRSEGGDSERDILPVLNKVDLVDADELAERERVVAEVVADFEGGDAERIAADPVAVSATAGDDLDALRERLADALPALREAELRLPNDDDAMSLVSWLYDRARVEDVEYEDSEVHIAFAGPESVVEKARARADALVGDPATPDQGP